MNIKFLITFALCFFVGNCATQKNPNQSSHYGLSASVKPTSRLQTSTPQSSIKINTQAPIQAISLIIGGIFIFCIINGASIYFYSRYKKNKK
jgi:hypothetical protein